MERMVRKKSSALGGRSPCGTLEDITGARKCKPLLATTTPPPSRPIKPIFSHMPRRNGRNSIAPARESAGPNESIADRRFIKVRGRLHGSRGDLQKP